LQVGTFDPTKKKKKKKKVRIQDDEETGENIEKVTEKVETLAGNKEDLLKRFTI
jgi:predicted transcriptional regulator